MFHTNCSMCIIFGHVHKISNKRFLAKHVRPSVRPHETTRFSHDGFSWNFAHFSNIRREKFKFHWSRTIVTGTVREDLLSFMLIKCSIVHIMRNLLYRIIDKIKTLIVSSMTFFPPNRAVYEIMWKSILEPDRP